MARAPPALSSCGCGAARCLAVLPPRPATSLSSDLPHLLLAHLDVWSPSRFSPLPTSPRGCRLRERGGGSRKRRAPGSLFLLTEKDDAVRLVEAPKHGSPKSAPPRWPMCWPSNRSPLCVTVSLARPPEQRERPSLQEQIHTGQGSPSCRYLLDAVVVAPSRAPTTPLDHLRAGRLAGPPTRSPLQMMSASLTFTPWLAANRWSMEMLFRLAIRLQERKRHRRPPHNG